MTKKNTEQDLSVQLLERDLLYLKTGIDDIKKELLCIKNSKVSKETFELINKSNQKAVALINKEQDLQTLKAYGQRGTSLAVTSANAVFLADRWRESANADGGTNPTLTRSRQILDGGFSYYF